ncbi:unnamed protein product [Mesocestoides corti]|uniref:EGF-like domain-containing protein n=1 Tax=Mesocestoides corti TaxID=53468 RepID=A0A0R3UQY2_MESCO|nr:unnamed protein product [Mesocestoides corti]
MYLCRPPFLESVMIPFAIEFLSLICLTTCSDNNCNLCQNVLEKFRITFYEVDSERSLGGGNTDWEEKYIGQYAFSDLHLLESIEQTSKLLTEKEAQFFTDIEGFVEVFWSDKLRTGQSNVNDITRALCIETLKFCCPWNKFGADCSDCGPCFVENGYCDGNGTRSGTGVCQCKQGYAGKSCGQCDHLTHFQSDSIDGIVQCTPCHPACAGGCSDVTPSSCVSCSKGYQAVKTDDGIICADVDECSNGSSPCKWGTYCVNDEGSYYCLPCPDGCSLCTNTSMCQSCFPGYTLQSGKCIDIDECSTPGICSGPHKRCVNKPGSYVCLCEGGYRLKQDMCIPVVSPRRGVSQPSHNKSDHLWAKRLLIEFAKLVFILLLFGILLYLTSQQTFLCISLAVAAVGFVYHEVNMLDAILQEV